MISYATLDELCLRYGDNTVLQLTDLERRGQINADIAQQALLDAVSADSAAAHGVLLRHRHLPLGHRYAPRQR